MNVFQLRNDLIPEYDSYISSFVNINDERIRNYVDQEIEEGLFWPNPLIQLNPSYEKGATIDALIDEGVLESGCKQFFRINKDDDDDGKPLQHFKHHGQDIRIADGAHNNADLTEKELDDILESWEDVTDPLDPESYQKRAAASTFPGETFRVLKEKEIRQYGEYRTRRLVLQAWERMQDSIDHGTEYVPMVDPPPAHPSLAHPWPDGTPYTGPGLVLDESQFEGEKQDPKPAVKEPAPEYTDAPPPPIDWDLYKCQGCGQILAGFARYEHVRDMHKGVDPGFEKFKES